MNKLLLAAALLFASLNGMSQQAVYHGTTASQYMSGKTIEFSRNGTVVSEESDLWFLNNNPNATPIYTEMAVYGENDNTSTSYSFVDMTGNGEELLSNGYTYDQSNLTGLHYWWYVYYSDGTWESVEADYSF